MLTCCAKLLKVRNNLILKTRNTAHSEGAFGPYLVRAVTNRHKAELRQSTQTAPRVYRVVT